MSKQDIVCIVSTGGTFDKVYDPRTEGMIFSGHSFVPQILRECGVNKIAFRSMMQIDSLDITEHDREHIFAYVSGLEFKRVVIVHGTSSLLQTARLFQKADLDRVFIFTGAMVPFNYRQTEASFNLGGAIAIARYMERGVFVYMHGETFDPALAEKDVSRARFFHIR